MPRSLVTGGAGFLGSHLCDRLIAEGHEVICMDNLLTGRPDNVRHLSEHPRFTFINGDVTKPIEIDGPLDTILHFASPASPKDYLKYPIHTLKVGALGSYHALGLAKAKRAVFLLASSSEVYGDPEVTPQPESYWGHVNPTGPRSVYDESKRYAEAITMAYHHTHGIDTRIVRIFNCFGERMRLDDGRALPTFITQGLRGEPITVYGDGSQTRSFCIHADELVPIIDPEGILHLRPIGEWVEELLPKEASFGNPERYAVFSLAPETGRAVVGRIRHLHCRPLDRRMLKIRLRWGGQWIRVTEDHKFLVWENNQENNHWIEKSASELQPGDRLPTALALPELPDQITHLDLIERFSLDIPFDDQATIFVRGEGIRSLIQTAKERLEDSFAQLHANLGLQSHYNHIVNRDSLSLPDYLKLSRAADFVPSPETLRLGVGGGRSELPARLPLTPEFLRLLGYFVAEGSYNQEYHLVFTNRDIRILNDLKRILEDLGLHFTEYTRPNGTSQITIGSKLLRLLFEHVLGMKAGEKCLPHYLYNLPRPLIAEFLKAYLSGDGWVTFDSAASSLRIGCTAYSPRLLQEIAFLFTLLGIPGTLSRTRFSISGQELVKRFTELISFVQEEANEKITTYLTQIRWKGGGSRLLKRRWRDVALNPVLEVQEIPGSTYVYDLQIDPHPTVLLASAGGVFVHNCYISDMIDGIYRLLVSDVNEPVNLGNPEEVTILEFAREIQELTGGRSKIVFEPLPENDPMVRHPDISKAEQLLGWKPRVSRREGLRRVLPYFEAALREEES